MSRTLTKPDYATVLVPVVEQALKNHDKARLFYETAADFAGTDPSAAWDDTKVGIGHLLRLDLILKLYPSALAVATSQGQALHKPGALPGSRESGVSLQAGPPPFGLLDAP